MLFCSTRALGDQTDAGTDLVLRASATHSQNTAVTKPTAAPKLHLSQYFWV